MCVTIVANLGRPPPRERCPLARRAWAEGRNGFDRAWWTRGAELGWAATLVPEDQGGGSVSENGLLDLLIVAEEMGRLVSPGPCSANSCAIRCR